MLQLAPPFVRTHASFEAAPRRLRTRSVDGAGFQRLAMRAKPPERGAVGESRVGDGPTAVCRRARPRLGCRDEAYDAGDSAPGGGAVVAAARRSMGAGFGPAAPR